MSASEVAIAYPARRFFISLITRDLTLEDAILDLIDNSINCALRTLQYDVDRIESLISNTDSSPAQTLSIDIQVTSEKFSIQDTCGGISIEAAREHIFRFGRDAGDHEEVGDTLSVYGIGLKRAIFKLGRRIIIKSHRDDHAFEVDINVDRWARDTNVDWTFPLREISPQEIRVKEGTLIEVTDLHPAIKEKIGLTLSTGALERKISSTYSFFLNRIVAIKLNRSALSSKALKFSSSAQIDSFEMEGCRVKIIAALASSSDDQTWRADAAGWYILCNGRAVLLADKTEKTGWGTNMGSFVSKFRGFIGMVLFLAEDPERLPWTTTKTGLNQESPVYQNALSRMSVAARPVLNFLNSLYGSSEVEADKARNAAAALEARPISELVATRTLSFSAPRGTTNGITRIQFDAKTTEIVAIQKHIKKALSARRIGRMCFDYYLQNEVDL